MTGRLAVDDARRAGGSGDPKSPREAPCAVLLFQLAIGNRTHAAQRPFGAPVPASGALRRCSERTSVLLLCGGSGELSGSASARHSRGIQRPPPAAAAAACQWRRRRGSSGGRGLVAAARREVRAWAASLCAALLPVLGCWRGCAAGTSATLPSASPPPAGSPLWLLRLRPWRATRTCWAAAQSRSQPLTSPQAAAGARHHCRAPATCWPSRRGCGLMACRWRRSARRWPWRQ